MRFDTTASVRLYARSRVLSGGELKDQLCIDNIHENITDALQVDSYFLSTNFLPNDVQMLGKRSSRGQT